MTKRVMVKETNCNIKRENETSLSSNFLLPPEWIIATKSQPAPHVVEFKDIFAVRKEITSMTLLWTFNSYHVDVKRRQFLINGGRRVRLDMQPDSEILYTRRNRTTVVLDGVVKDGGGKHEITYLLGLQDMIGSKRREIMVHISSNGSEWCWKEHR